MSATHCPRCQRAYERNLGHRCGATPPDPIQVAVETETRRCADIARAMGEHAVADRIESKRPGLTVV